MTELFSLPPFPKTALIVDDEPKVGHLIAEIVSSNGFDPITVTTAEAALPEIENRAFALLIADKNLPGIDGIELMRGMRMMQPHCACIMVTAFASKDSAVEAVHLGAADYITKPFDDIYLVGRRIVRAVARHRLEYEVDNVVEQARTLLAVTAGDDDEPALVDLLNATFERVLAAALKSAGVAGNPESVVAAAITALRGDTEAR